MKYRHIALVIAVFAACTELEVSQDTKDIESLTQESPVYVDGEIRVLFDEDLTLDLETALENGSMVTKSSGLNEVFSALNITSARRLFAHGGEFEPRMRKEGLHRWYVVEFEKDIPVTKAADDFRSLPGIELVEMVERAKLLSFDDMGSKLWGLYNESVPGIDINVKHVWESYTVGAPEVIVSVVDAGVDLNHEDLASNCAKSNHFNFVDNNAVITAGDHGTHVAGTIAAVSNNGKGVAGIAGGDFAAGKSGVTLLSCQAFKDLSDGSSRSGNFPAAIVWGANHGAVISQNSWGYNYDSNQDGKLTGQELENAMSATIDASDRNAVDYFIKYAGCDNEGNQLPDSPMKGGVVIFAAGNDNIANGAPANYEPIISVGAISSNGTKAAYSNYGDWVDICAPGSDIYSTTPQSTYSYMNGTSMACPHVSGVAALIVSYAGGQGFTNEMLVEKLLSGANKTAVPMSYKIGNLVDALGSITYGTDAEPAKVVDLAAQARSNFLDLSWTMVKDTDDKPVYGYYLFYSADRAKLEQAEVDGHDGVVMDIICPNQQAGEKVNYTIKGLDFETTYYVKILSYGYNMKKSADSEIIAVETLKNSPPVINVEGGKNLRLKSDAQVVLYVSFSEPDGHKFNVSYQPGSSADTFKDNYDGKWHLVITAKNAEPGLYQATIIVEDEFGAVATSVVGYEVLKNNPPTAVSQIENVLLKGSGEVYSLDLSKYFTDVDGDALKYECLSSNERVAFVNANGNTAYVTATGYGNAEATITARDARSEGCSLTFKVAVKDASDPLEVYPNPVTDYLNIRTLDETNTNIVITSSTGQIILDESMTMSVFNPVKVDMTPYAPGIYSVSVTLQGKQYKKTIVKL